MDPTGGVVQRIDGRGPAAARVRAAVLAAAARPGGCPPRDLPDAVAASLGTLRGPALDRRVDGALGLLVATGWIDEAGGRLVPAAGVRAAV